MSGDTIIYSDNEVIVRGEPLAGSIVWQGVSGPYWLVDLRNVMARISSPLVDCGKRVVPTDGLNRLQTRVGPIWMISKLLFLLLGVISVVPWFSSSRVNKTRNRKIS